MNEAIDAARQLGLEGNEALQFIREQQELQRAERQEAREEAERVRQETERARQEAERGREEAERQKQHELQMAELLNREGRRENERVNGGKSPKLP